VLPKLPALAALDARGCFLAGGGLPASVAACTGLRSLRLGDNALREVPRGPYLERLEQLSLDVNP